MTLLEKIIAYFKKIKKITDDVDGQVIKRTTGPAYVDKIARYMDGIDACFIQESAKIFNTLPKQVILAYLVPFKQNIRANNDFISTLIENFDVKIWQEDTSALEAQLPIQTLSDFYQIINKHTGATKDYVEKTFARSGINANQYIIIDREIYYTFVGKSNNRISLKELSNFDFEEIKLSTNWNDITEVDIGPLNENELNFILVSPNLEIIRITNVSPQWIERYYPLFKNKDLTLSLSNIQSPAPFHLTLPSYIPRLYIENNNKNLLSFQLLPPTEEGERRLVESLVVTGVEKVIFNDELVKSFHIKHQENSRGSNYRIVDSKTVDCNAEIFNNMGHELEKFDNFTVTIISQPILLAGHSKIKSLTVKCEEKDFDGKDLLTNFDGLKSLTISRGFNFKLPPIPSLIQLTLRQCNAANLNELADLFPNLETLKLVRVINGSPEDLDGDEEKESIIITIPSSIKTLVIDDSHIRIKDGDLTACTLLTSLHLKTYSDDFFTDGLKLNDQLREFYAYCDRKYFDANFLSQCPHLEKLKLKSISDLHGLNLSYYSNLKSLFLSNINVIHNLNFSHTMHELTRLTLLEIIEVDNISANPASFPSLRVLEFGLNMNVEGFISPSLEEVIIHSELLDYSTISKANNLKKLELQKISPSFPLVEWIQMLPKLNNLLVRYEDIKDFQDAIKIKLNNCPNLTYVNIYGMSNSVEIDFSEISYIHSLDIQGKELTLNNINHCFIRYNTISANDCIFKNNSTLIHSRAFNLTCKQLVSEKILTFYPMLKNLTLKLSLANVIFKSLDNWHNLVKLSLLNESTPDMTNVENIFIQNELFSSPNFRSLFLLILSEGKFRQIQNEMNKANSIIVISSQNKSSHMPLLGLNGNIKSNSILSKKSLTQYATLDNKTGAQGDLVSSGEIAVNIISKAVTDEDALIFSRKTHLIYDTQGRMALGSNPQYVPANIRILSVDQQQLNNICQEASESTLHKAIIVEFDLAPGEKIPIIADRPLFQNFTIFSDHADELILLKDNGFPFYAVELKSGVPTIKLKILTYYEINDYDKGFNNIGIIRQYHTQPCPQPIVSALENALQNDARFNGWKFIIDPHLPLNTKMSILEEKLLSFKDEELSPSSALPLSIDLLLQIVAEEKGVCRHRTFIFMVFALYLRVIAFACESRLHSYGSYMAYTSTNEQTCRRMNFGGGNNYRDLTPPSVFKSLFSESSPSINLQDELSGSNETIEFEKMERAIYEAQLAELINEKLIYSPQMLFNRSKSKAPLVLIDSHDPIIINEQFVLYCKETKRNLDQYLYIHDPEDLVRYTKTYVVAENSRKRFPGKLIRLFEQGGILVINLTTFSPADIMGTISLVDDDKRWGKWKVKSKLEVIFLIRDVNIVGDALTTRTQCYKLSADFIKPITDLPPLSETENNCTVVDLHHCVYWREILLALITQQGSQIIIQAGNLLDAVTGKTPPNVVIYNAPQDDKYFNEIIRQIKYEKSIVFNGNKIPIPDNFKFHLVENKKSLITNNITFIPEHQYHSNCKFIHIGQYNLHECVRYDYYHLGLAHTKPGYLDLYDENKYVFYITESINESNWLYLLRHLQNYSHKHFTFVIAPGVKVSNIAQNDNARQNIASDNSAFIYTNDPQYAAAQIRQTSLNADQHVKQFNMTPQDSYSSYFVYISTIETTNNEVKYIYEERAALQALKQGFSVILTGNIDEESKLRLLPLTMPHNSVYFLNGEFVTLDGKLKVVQHIQALHSNEPMAYVKQEYQLSDYINGLSEEERTLHADNIHKIEKFYYYASVWKTQEPLPPIPFINFQRFKNLLNNLSTPLHSHNPIKDIFHYDYPKDSAIYAYLNVVAKLIFSELDAAPLQIRKLRNLINRYSIALDNLAELKQYCWQILNCFRSADIQRMFGNILTLLDLTNTYPELTKNHLTILSHQLNALDLNQNFIQTPHTHKRSKLFTELLDRDDCQVILLVGGAGTGKSHDAKAILKSRGYQIEEPTRRGVLNVLTGPPNKKYALLLDEGNQAMEGTWNFIEGLLRPNETYTTSDGSIYPIPDNLIIIVTMNPASFGHGRTRHELFQSHGRSVLYAIPENAFFEKQILNSILPKEVFSSFYTNMIIKAYELACRLNPNFPYSIRDIANCGYRFAYLLKLYHQPKLNNQASALTGSLLFEACIQEFLYSIASPKQRKLFTDQMIIIFNDMMRKISLTQVKPTLRMHPRGVYINQRYYPAAKRNMINSVKQDIGICLYVSQQINTGFHKRLIMIEGASGTGKTTLAKGLLIEHGYNENATDLSKKLYHMTFNGNISALEETLQLVIQHKSALILDEINLDQTRFDKTLENVFIKYLDDLENAGCIIIATLNASSDSGRIPPSKALLNRAHYIYMPTETPEELFELAKEAKIDNPKLFVEVFIKMTKNIRDPMRIFYNYLNYFTPLEEPLEQIAQLDETTMDEYFDPNKRRRIF